MRGTWLGVFGGAIDLLSRENSVIATEPLPGSTVTQVKPRKRGRMCLPNLSAAGDVMSDVDT